jgi:hypothetical protein
VAPTGAGPIVAVSENDPSAATLAAVAIGNDAGVTTAASPASLHAVADAL